ncbi:MAG: hypothetical protein LBE04_03930 [Prevotellaceae bacterium]|jgi:hypothetical protein|nr:hypothetical protein [Prevotellaceae bacterium]
MKHIFISIIMTVTAVTGFVPDACSQKIPAYKDVKLPVEQRVDDLMN